MQQSSLIPDEYVADRVERRRTMVGSVLFVVVMTCVVGAFLVTNSQWDTVRARQAEVKVSYDDVSAKIARMEVLRSSRDDLVRRAELASALISRVPRSYLISGLVDRMPPRVSWISMDMESSEIREPQPRPDAADDRLQPRGPAAAPVRSRGPNAHAPGEEVELTPRRYQTSIVLTGLAPDEVDVSMYVAALQEFELLQSVMPDSTEIVEIDDIEMRRFKITMSVDIDVEEGFAMPMIGGGGSMTTVDDSADRLAMFPDREEN